ncbi:MAG: FAD binding domain-containing protein [Burkholderiales bacterium]|nr:FAD binding domain-containing protein [Burkholderiales bacterium]
MIPRAFDYHDPVSANAALALLAELGDEAKLMAGGQSLLPMMKLRVASPAHIVDLWRVRGLDAIGIEGDDIRIGALATHRALEDSELLRKRCPLLAKAAATIADPQVRNVGTIGGAAAHADPSANYSPALVALGAKLVLRSKEGERVVPAAQFFKDFFVTELRPTELITEVRVPALAEGDGWGVREAQPARAGFRAGERRRGGACGRQARLLAGRCGARLGRASAAARERGRGRAARQADRPPRRRGGGACDGARIQYVERRARGQRLPQGGGAGLRAPCARDRSGTHDERQRGDEPHDQRYGKREEAD